METKKVYLATPVGDPSEIDIRRKAEQAKEILESKDPVIENLVKLAPQYTQV